MNLFSLVVPVKCDTYVPSAFPLSGDSVMLFCCFLQVHHVFFTDVFDSKIINSQHELHWAPFVLQQPHDKLALMAALLVQMYFSKSSLASSPDCGKPYIPQFATMYTDPSFVALAFKLYSLMISYGMSLNLTRMYSGRANGVMR